MTTRNRLQCFVYMKSAPAGRPSDEVAVFEASCAVLLVLTVFSCTHAAAHKKPHVDMKQNRWHPSIRLSVQGPDLIPADHQLGCGSYHIWSRFSKALYLFIRLFVCRIMQNCWMDFTETLLDFGLQLLYMIISVQNYLSAYNNELRVCSIKQTHSEW